MLTIVSGANFSFTDSRPASPSLSLRSLSSINSAQAFVNCSIFFGSINRPVFSFTTSFAPSTSKDTAGLPHSIAWGRVRARPSLSEQCTRISDDCMASGIWLGGKRPVNLTFSANPNWRTCFLKWSARFPSPTNSQMALSNCLLSSLADSIIYLWPFSINSRAMVTRTIASSAT
ncbi:hypothetical protein ES703_56289 [subsurface metagenome]